MALVVFDRVKETSNTSGTGTIVLAGAVTGYQSFALVGNANTTYYTIADQSGSNWEVGIGTYYTGNVSLARTTILASSNANAAVNFTNATHDVFITYPAEKAVYLDSSNNATPSFGTFSGAVETLTGTGTNLLLRSTDLTNVAWANTNLGSITGGQTDPFGGTTASLINEGTSANYHYLNQNPSIASGTYTLSVYAKAGTSNYIGIFGTVLNQGAIFNLTTGAFTGNYIGAPVSYASTNTGLPAGWWRVSIVITGAFGFGIATSSNGTATTYTGTSQTVYVSSPQIEIGNILNAYTATTTTAIYGTPTLSFSGVANVTLNSSGTMNLSSAGSGSIGLLTNGGANTQALIAHTANAVNYIQLTGAGTGGAPVISAQGADGTAQLALTSKGATSLRFYTNSLSAEQFRISSTTSAVNYWNPSGSAATNGITMSAQGSDTDISMFFITKGAGSHVFTSGGSSSTSQFRITHTANAVNYVQATGGATGANVTVSAQGSDANIGVSILNKGSGAIALGGNSTSDVFRIYSNNSVTGGNSAFTAPAFYFIAPQSNFGASIASLGSNPRVTAIGTDGFYFGTNGSVGYAGTTQLKVSDTASAVNYANVTGGTTGNAVTISAAGSDSNISIALTPKGSGTVNVASNVFANSIFSTTETIRGTGTNLLLRSTDLTNAAWTQTNLTLTGSQADPFGGTTASLFNDGTTASVQHYLTVAYTATAQTYTLSCYAKAGTANYFGMGCYTSGNFGVIFNLTTGAFSANIGSAPTSYSSTNAGNGWWRLSITVPFIAGTNYFGLYMSEDGTSYSFTGTSKTVYVAAPQLEIGPTTNTYVPTTTTAIYGTPLLSFSGVANVTLDSSGTMNLSSAGTGSINLGTTNGTILKVLDNGATTSYWNVLGNPALLYPGGTNANINGSIGSKGTGAFQVYTNGGNQLQLNIPHTASAVNYVQATGGATGANVTVSAQGSDTNIGVNLAAKGSGSVYLQSGSNTAMKVDGVYGGTGTAANYWNPSGSSAGNGLRMDVGGSDTDISMFYIAKGLGSHYFNSGGSSGTIQFRINPIANSVNYVQASGGATGNNPYLYSNGSDTNINFRYYTKGTGSHIFATQGSTSQFYVIDTISAVNYVQVTGGTTGNAVTIYAGGSDTDVGINLASRAAGSILLRTNTTTTQALIAHTASANNYVQMTGGAGVGPTISAAGADTNIDLKLTPKGTGYANITSGGIKFPDATVQTTAAGLVAGNSSIIINNVNITSNATIAAGQNGFSVGPVTTANGVSVTIASGQSWVVI
jgi:hypothetical protein